MASAPRGDLCAITSALHTDHAALGVDIDCILSAPMASAATKLTNNKQRGATCAARQEAAACQCMDDEGTRVERANDEQGRAERELALACLGYEQEWPLLAKAKER